MSEYFQQFLLSFLVNDGDDCARINDCSLNCLVSWSVGGLVGCIEMLVLVVDAVTVVEVDVDMDVIVVRDDQMIVWLIEIN